MSMQVETEWVDALITEENTILEIFLINPNSGSWNLEIKISN
jgi:hypothetical protein